MTCIVGLVDNGKVYLGGDSAGVAGWSLTVRADSKVYSNGPYILGFTSSFRMGQLLRHAFDPPTPPDQDLERFMCTTFIDAVRKCLQMGGYATKKEDAEQGGNFLVGVAGRLFEVHSDYQVGEAVDGYSACGCGEEIALGSLHATALTGMAPHARVTLALQAAERFSAGVRGPFAHVDN